MDKVAVGIISWWSASGAPLKYESIYLQAMKFETKSSRLHGHKVVQVQPCACPHSNLNGYTPNEVYNGIAFHNGSDRKKENSKRWRKLQAAQSYFCRCAVSSNRISYQVFVAFAYVLAVKQWNT